MTMCVALHAIVRLESKDVCRNFLRGGGGTAPIGRTHSHFSLAMGGSTSISGYFNRSYQNEKFRDMGGVWLALPGQRLHAPVLESFIFRIVLTFLHHLKENISRFNSTVPINS